MGSAEGRHAAQAKPRRSGRRPHIVILVVNLPPEKDRRVIRETQALEAAGCRVTVIGPRGQSGTHTLPGTRDAAIRSFRQPFAGAGIVSFALEFCWAFLAVCTRLLGVMLRSRVDAVQACNPPDVFWPVALFLRVLRRPFVFDHHDLSPELYQCKTAEPNRIALRVLHLFERLSWRCASAVVATNESYRELAINRGGCSLERVVVVRNGPSLAEVAAAPEVPAPRGTGSGPVGAPGPGRQVVAYVGVINAQDCVEIAVLAAERLAELRGRDDWQLVIAGDGERLPAIRELAAERGVDDVVRFTGWLEQHEVRALLRTACVAIQPDGPSLMSELSTMAKTVEYVAYGVPVVSVDLREARRTAGDAAIYVPTGTPDEFAKAIDQLLGDRSARAMMHAVAVERFTTSLAWDHQAESYIRLWGGLLAHRNARYNSLRSSVPVGEVAEPKR